MLRNQIKHVGRGDDSLLLVFTPPAEALIPNSDPSCMAIPVLPREGVFLLAVPDGYFANDAIMEAALSEEGEVLGPSSDMSAPLVEEDDSGLEVAIGYEAKFLLIDVSDAALSMLREYDPVIDPSSEICPYSKDRPLAILDIGAVMPNINAWLESPGGAERMNFYSAREEQQPPMRSQVPKASPKKAGARRVTAAALAETVAALTDQVKLLCSAAGDHDAAAATIVALGHSCSRACAWSRHAGKASSCFCRNPTKWVAKHCQGCSTVGAAPKVEAAGRVICARCSPRRDHAACSDRPRLFDARCVTCIASAVSCDYHSGSSLDPRGSPDRARRQFILQSRVAYKRRRTKRENAAGTSRRPIEFLPAGSTADFQANVPVATTSKGRERADQFGGFPLPLPGEVWRLQKPKRDGHDHVDVSPQPRCVRVGQQQVVQRVPSSHRGLHRTKCHGPQLELGICPEFTRGATYPGLHGEIISCDVPGTSFCSSGAATTGSSGSCLPEGVRPSEQSQDGIESHQADPGESGGARFSFAQAKTEVSKETQTRGGGPLVQQLRECEHITGAIPDFCHSNPSSFKPFDAEVRLDSHVSVPLGNQDGFACIEPRIKNPVNPKPVDAMHSSSSSCLESPGNPCMHSQVPRLRTDRLDLPKWRSLLVPLVLRSRTAFSSFLSRTIRLTRRWWTKRPRLSFLSLFPVVESLDGCPLKHLLKQSMPETFRRRSIQW